MQDPLQKTTTGQVLSPADISVLHVLINQQGRIISRATIQRLADLDSVSARRVDASIVALRRRLGAEAVVTVRRRGWMLADHAVGPATELLALQIELPR